MSVNELKHALRKYDFPSCAKEALIRIEQILAARTAPTNKQLDMVMEIIAEFVFCESDRRGSRKSSSLSPLSELQLIDIICDHLASCTNDTTKNTIFLSLFGGAESQKRLKILSILASMAVSASSSPVLLAVGVWLQQMGCSSTQSLKLVENIIQDHFYLNTSNQMSLKQLAKTVPEFVANFIAAVTELYLNDLQNIHKMPPKHLLEVITSWVFSNPTLCMSAQLNPPSLPSGSIPMAAVTPLSGLIHWCALAHLNKDEDSDPIDLLVPIKRIKLENENTIVKSAQTKYLSESELYIKLHLGVLQSLRAGKRIQGPPTAVNAQHLMALTTVVQAHAHQSMRKGAKLEEKKIQECLDSIGQAAQVALANGCVYGNINKLLSSLETLPENRLLRIIIKTHKQT